MARKSLKSAQRNLLSLAPTSLGDLGPLEFIATCAKSGYDAIGVRVQPSPGRPSVPVVGDAKLIREMKQAIAGADLGVLEVFTFYMLPEIDFEEYRRSLDVGADLGAHYCLVCCNDPEWSRQRDNYGRFCDLAAEFDLGVTVEFAPIHTLSTLQKAIQLHQEVNRPNASILVDPVHFMRGGGRIEELRGLDPSLFAIAQIADGVLAPGEPPAVLGPQMGSGTRKLTGQGTMPLAEILDALPQGLPLSIECLPRPEGMSAQTWSDEVLRTTREFLDGYYSRRAAVR